MPKPPAQDLRGGLLRAAVVASVAIALVATGAQLSLAAVATKTTLAGPTRLELTNSARLTVSVSPNRSGKGVTLQKYAGGKWSPMASATLNSSSQYVFSFRPTAVGTYSFRAVKPAEGAYSGSISATLRMTVVHKVRYLASTYKTVETKYYGRGLEVDTTKAVGGQNRVHSLAHLWRFSNERQGYAYQDFSIGGAWNSINFLLGVTDDSPMGHQVRLEVFGDGRSLGTWMTSLGNESWKSLKVTGVRRLRFQSSVDFGADVVIGVPRLSTATTTAPTTTSPVTRFLTDFERVAEYYSGVYVYKNYVIRTAGSYYAQSMSWRYQQRADCTGSNCVEANAEYNLSRAYKSIRFRGGIEDESSGSAKITIYGDGAQLWSGNVAFGSSPPVTVSVSGVLRLKIAVRALTPGADVTLADFRVFA